MKLLLDTHVLLWWLAASPTLPNQARNLIAAPTNAIFISAVSLWEIWLKVSLDKLRVPADFEERLADQAFENLPLMAAHTRAVAQLPWHHRDPFDRMLLAQARVADLMLVTADDVMAVYGEAVLLVS